MSRPVRPPVGITREREIGGVRIATPCYGGVANVRFVDSLLRTQRLLDIEGIKNDWHCIDNESLIQRARNGMAAMFMTTGAEYLLFIDADIQWQPSSVLRLLAHDVDVICATYPKKCEKKVGDYSLDELQAQIDWLEWHKRTIELGHTRPDPANAPTRPAEWPLHANFNARGISRYNEKTGAIEINSAATGFLCIHRRVFAKMAESGVISKIEAMQGVDSDILTHLYDYFWTGVEDGILWSEDYGFSRKWRQIGGEIWLDPSIWLHHVGQKVYDGDPTAIYGEPDEPILSLDAHAAA